MISLKRAFALIAAAVCLLAGGCAETPISDADNNIETASYEEEKTAAKTVNTEETYTYENMPIDGYVTECTSCNKAFDYNISKLMAIHYIEERQDSDNLYFRAYNAIEERLYPLMKHDCSLPVIYVENYPYSFYRVNGYYTGYWQGACPSGDGYFIGFDRMSSGDGYYEYKGEWKYGLPNGAGFCIEQSGLSGYQSIYRGDFQDGYRSGTGTCCQILMDKYRVMQNAEWANGNIAGETAVVDYNISDGEIYGWGTAVPVGGYLEFTDYMTTQGVKDQAKVAALIASFVLFNKLMDEIFPPTEIHHKTSQEWAEEVNQYQEKKAKEAAENQEYCNRQSKAYADAKVKQYDQMGDNYSSASKWWRNESERLQGYA